MRIMRNSNIEGNNVFSLLTYSIHDNPLIVQFRKNTIFIVFIIEIETFIFVDFSNFGLYKRLC